MMKKEKSMNGILGTLYGMNIIEDRFLPVTQEILIRKSRSKKRRLIKKWMKNKRNYIIKTIHCIKKDNYNFLVSSKLAEQLKDLDKFPKQAV